MALKGRLEDYTEVEFLALLNGICNFDCQDEETHSIWVEHFVRVSQHPKGTDLIFWPEDDDDSSPEGILNAVKEWRASNDLPGFYEGEPSSAKSVETPR
ncbi:bacteriocin immunity protein (plasmid) [Pseudomonas yamanorum]|nr:bacteriocin immunity protein [Pseudomonas yamanorum]